MKPNYPMGADLIYSMLFIEISETEAKKRVDELTLEILARKDERDHWLLRNHEDQLDDLFYEIEENSEHKTEEVEFAINQFIDLVKEEAKQALDVVYAAWDRGTYHRDTAAFNVKGNRGLITADMSWGDSWERLEQFELLNILELTVKKE
jgi:hypothetical protein